jgi:1-acyl-sn-glycerol-3-phosphate acyltransferase
MHPKTKSLTSRAVFNTLRSFAHTVSKIVWQVRFEGIENIPGDSPRGLVVAANHQTYIDPVWISIPFRKRLGFLAWDRAFTWPVIGPLIRYLGAVPVDTKTGRNHESWKMLLDVLSEGGAVLIFPEGEREFADGALLPFRQGAARLAMEARVPILPVSVVGANRVWPQGMKWPRPSKVVIVFHPPIDVPRCGSPEEEKSAAREINEKLRMAIASSLPQCQ